MNEIAADFRRFGLMLALGVVAVVALLGYCAGARTIKQDLRVAALRDTVRIRDSVRVTIRDTVTVYRRRVDTVKAESDSAKAVSDSLDALVGIRDDSTLLFPDTALVVPPLLVANLTALRGTVAKQDRTIATQDTLLRWWERKSAADSLAIEARDRLIHELRPPKCGRRCGFALGVATVAGVVYLVK